MALSDPGGILASPLTIIDRQDEKQDLQSVIAIIGRYQVGRVIVGLPRSMDGGLGRQAEKVMSFAEELRGLSRVPVGYRDERLTTVAAKRLLRDAGAGRNRKRARDDAAAAAIILQGYLDERHNSG